MSDPLPIRHVLDFMREKCFEIERGVTDNSTINQVAMVALV